VDAPLDDSFNVFVDVVIAGIESWLNAAPARRPKPLAASAPERLASAFSRESLPRT